jgi:hypothetical protein
MELSQIEIDILDVSVQYCSPWIQVLTDEFAFGVVNSLGALSETDECTVFIDNMVIYTNGDEDYAELVHPLLKEAITSGQFNSAHPAIVRTTFLDQLPTESQTEAESASVDGGFNKYFLLYDILGIVIIVLVIAGLLLRKRRGQ